MIRDLIDRIKLPFRKDKELYFSIQRIVGFYPHHIDYFKQALMHKSIGKRNAKGRPINNERLEFLGDAILGAVVGDIVFRHFEGKREGFLTNTRSKIVQRETLNRLAREMGVNDMIVSSGHSSSHNSYVGGNAFEALIGAIYLDRGYDACMRFMEKRVLNELINIDKVAYKEVNFKSKLIEWSQKNRVKLDFKLLEQTSDEKGSPVFTYQVVLEGIECDSGTGYSKKESQQQASKMALQRLRKNPQFIDSVFAAKANRTKMEEEPRHGVPDTEQKEEFFISEGQPQEKRERSREEQPQEQRKNIREEQSKEQREMVSEKRSMRETAIEEQQPEQPSEEPDEFDLSDISAAPKELSREEIIAAAEEAAFAATEEAV
ncbi:MAG: ribonuclease III [Prevotella sp.]|nr:ribonuclease III [Prevotella sp.]